MTSQLDLDVEADEKPSSNQTATVRLVGEVMAIGT